MKYYIPTSTLNISNILSSGSISPYSFYGKRKFGINTFESIKECENFRDQIILFRKYPLFSIISDKESYPVCIEIELPDNLVTQSNILDIYYSCKTIYISPTNTSFVFENEEFLNKSLFWIGISDEAKFYEEYKDKFILREGINETFELTENTLNNLIIEQTSDIETEVVKDRQIDKIRGALCGLFIGANGFEGSDRTGISFQRNIIRELVFKLLQVFEGHDELVKQTDQLQKSALSEFAKKELNIHQLCTVQKGGQLYVQYNEDNKIRIDFYNELLNRLLINSEPLTQQIVNKKGGQLLSLLYGNRWKTSSDYNYLIQLYNNVTKYDNFDLKSNESIILRSFAAFVQRGLGEWDKLRDYLNERNMSIPDRRFIYGLYGAINGFSTLSKTMTDIPDISDKALYDFINDMNEKSRIDSTQQEANDVPEMLSEKIKEQLGATDEVELHIWQKEIIDFAAEEAIKQNKKKLKPALEEALIENGKNTDYFVFFKSLASYDGWSQSSKVWKRMQEHFVPDYYSRMGIKKTKRAKKSVAPNNDPGLFSTSFEENGKINTKSLFFEDNYAWEKVRTMVPLQIRENTQIDFMWLQQEYQKAEHSKYYAKASRENTTVIEALKRLLLKKDYIKGKFEKEIEQIIQYLHHHYDQR